MIIIMYQKPLWISAIFKYFLRYQIVIYVYQRNFLQTVLLKLFFPTCEKTISKCLLTHISQKKEENKSFFLSPQNLSLKRQWQVPYSMLLKATRSCYVTSTYAQAFPCFWITSYKELINIKPFSVLNISSHYAKIWTELKWNSTRGILNECEANRPRERAIVPLHNDSFQVSDEHWRWWFGGQVVRCVLNHHRLRKHVSHNLFWTELCELQMCAQIPSLLGLIYRNGRVMTGICFLICTCKWICIGKSGSLLRLTDLPIPTQKSIN